MRRLSALVIPLLLLSACAASRSTQQATAPAVQQVQAPPYVSERCGYSVRIPGTPQEQFPAMTSKFTDNGVTHTMLYGVASRPKEGVTFQVVCTNGDRNGPPRDELIAESRKRPDVRKLTLPGGHPGYEVKKQQEGVEDPYESVRRSFQVGERLYTLVVYYPASQQPPAEMADFFESFTLK